MKIIITFLKGLAMGSADLVPGVSGGTIAIIVGIYTKLLDTIVAVNKEFFCNFFTLKFKQAFKNIDLTFILPLLAGILTAIFTLANLVSYLLQNETVYIFSFFFGLVLSSVFLLLILIKKESSLNYLGFILGVIGAYLLVGISPIESPKGHLMFFLSGAIAICAMILPGISGSFVLLLLGKYTQVLEAVTQLDFVVILEFSLGALVGILSFARFLKYLLAHHYSITMSVLTGLILGSLRKVYPWNGLPAVNSESFIALAIMLFGFVFVLILHKLSEKKSN